MCARLGTFKWAWGSNVSLVSRGLSGLALCAVTFLVTVTLHGPLWADIAAKGPVIEQARGEKCVEPPGVMRRQHWEFLKHQRDDTVHGGIRGAKYSLKSCVACHASLETNSVTAAKTNFCVSCHVYTAVKIDCFECHANRPDLTNTAFLPLVHPDVGTSKLRQLARKIASGEEN